MQGTQLRELDVLTRAIMEYYANKSGYDITAEDIATRDLVVPWGMRPFPDSLDEQMLALQEQYVQAQDLSTAEATKAAAEAAVVSAISLLSSF